MGLAEETHFISAERQRWISCIANQDTNIAYLRQLSRAEVLKMVPNPDGINFMDNKKTGREFLIEYHLFMKDDVIPIGAPWRATDGGEVHEREGTKPTSRADRRCKCKAEGMVTEIDTNISVKFP